MKYVKFILQNAMKNIFCRALELKKHDFVTVVGGGGKSSLLDRLWQELLSEEEKVFLTTSTHMLVPEDYPGPVFLREGTDTETYAARLAGCPDLAVFSAEYQEKPGKVKGAEDELPCLLYEKLQDRIFLCEGDGTAGHSFKILRKGEPVIPAVTTRLIYVAGADAWGKPCGAVVFRCPDQYADTIFDGEFWRRQLGIALDQVRTMYSGPIDLMINKAEGPRRAAAEEMARCAAGLADRVWISSLQEGILIPVSK